MIGTSPRLWSILIALIIAPVVHAEIFVGHHPYQDPHFDRHHTPLYSNAGGASYGDYHSHAATCSCADCNGNQGDLDANNPGSRSPKCPPVDNAKLQLYVADGLRVEINGQQTKEQTLGGVHRNSRIFLLDGLERNQLSTCEIVVYDCDAFGLQTQHNHAIWVRAGENYRVRYRNGLFQSSHPGPANEWITPSTTIL